MTRQPHPWLTTQEKRKLAFIQKPTWECLQQFHSSSALDARGQTHCGTCRLQNTAQQEEGTRLSFQAAIWMHAKCIFLREKSQNHFRIFGKRQTGCQSQEGVEEGWTGRGRTGKLGMPAARIHIKLSSPCAGNLTRGKKDLTIWPPGWLYPGFEEPTRIPGEPKTEYCLGRSKLAMLQINSITSLKGVENKEVDKELGKTVLSENKDRGENNSTQTLRVS